MLHMGTRAHAEPELHVACMLQPVYTSIRYICSNRQTIELASDCVGFVLCGWGSRSMGIQRGRPLK